MRKLSNTILNILNSDNVEMFSLVKIIVRSSITAKSIVLRSTNAQFNIVVPGDGTYSASDLAFVDPPRVSNTLDRAVYNISFIDPMLSKRALFEGNLNGYRVEVRVGFFNNTDNTISGVLPGQPFLNSEDLTVVYAGFVDTCSYSINPDSGEILANIECSSPMNSLNLKRAFYTSREEARAVNPNDSSFDLVFAGSGPIALKWGKG